MSQRYRLFISFVLTVAVAIAAAAMTVPVSAQQPKEVEVALIVPLSGPWARQGVLERMGAEMAIDDINKSGGIKALGGAKMKLIISDAGDSAEKAKNAAQRLVAQNPERRRRCRRLAEFVHAGGDRGHRACGTAMADTVLFRRDHRARLPLRVPDLGDRRPAIRARLADHHGSLPPRRPESGQPRPGSSKTIPPRR